MKKTISFGKVDYLNHGRRDCEVTVDIELRTRDDGRPELSICGNIWNARHSDIYTGGQNLDTIAEYIKTTLFREIYRLWRLYHLNGMHPECEHQRELGWRQAAGEYVNIFRYKLTREASSAQAKLKDAILDAARAGKAYQMTPEEMRLLSLEYFIKRPQELTAEEREYYAPYDHEKRMKGWLKPEEHPDGILCKPCPVCGYKYGSAWKYAEIPEDDLNRIKELIAGGK